MNTLYTIIMTTFASFFILASSAFAAESPVPLPQANAGNFIPLMMVVVVFYFLILRPQFKKAKEHKQMTESMKRGSKVITAGGIEAVVTSVKDGERMIEVEIASGVKINIVKDSITDLIADTTIAKGNTPKKNKKKAL